MSHLNDKTGPMVSRCVLFTFSTRRRSAEYSRVIGHCGEIDRLVSNFHQGWNRVGRRRVHAKQREMAEAAGMFKDRAWRIFPVKLSPCQSVCRN